MVRTQIQLTEAQARTVQEAARQQQISASEVIRRCIDASLVSRRQDRSEAYRKALAFAGSIQDREGASDLASAHDRYLTEAFE